LNFNESAISNKEGGNVDTISCTGWEQ